MSSTSIYNFRLVRDMTSCYLLNLNHNTITRQVLKSDTLDCRFLEFRVLGNLCFRKKKLLVGRLLEILILLNAYFNVLMIYSFSNRNIFIIFNT